MLGEYFLPLTSPRLLYNLISICNKMVKLVVAFCRLEAYNDVKILENQFCHGGGILSAWRIRPTFSNPWVLLYNLTSI